ncbi:MAG: flagellin FliC [Bdellovibrionales bacterium]|nr:flagellin FliC [Bdellovibrionales bacterium]
MSAQRAMSEHNKQIETTSGKISSGSRVRNASDDAAGLAIGNKQKTSIRSQYQAIRNGNDAISQFQVAEGAMSEIGNMLVRLKELSLQAASGHMQDSDRGMLNNEYMQIRREVERVAQTTRYNGVDLLHDKSSKTRDFLIGTNNDENSKLSYNSTEVAVSEFNLSLVDSNVINAEEARINISHIDKAIETLSGKRAKIGSYQNRIQASISNLETKNVNETEAMSRTMDADMAYETAEKMRSEGKMMAASSVLSQSHAFSAMALKLLK